MASKETKIGDENAEETAIYHSALNLFLQTVLHKAMLFVLHNKGNDSSYVGLPENPENLYLYFSTSPQIEKLQHLKKRHIIPRALYDKIFPSNSRKTDSNSYDLSLIFLVIQNFVTFDGSKNNRWRDPKDNDLSIALSSKKLEKLDCSRTCFRNYTLGL